MLMNFLNQTVFDINFKWDRNKFEASRSKCRIARKRIDASINIQIEKQMRSVFSQNIQIEQSIDELNQQLWKHHDKLRLLDNMIELASQSLNNYFEKRMETVRAVVHEHCRFIQQILHEESEHWKEIHSILDQNLINPGDIRSRNNFPKSVTKSPAPNIQAIAEIDEEEYLERKLSKISTGNTLTPLLTKLIRKSRFARDSTNFQFNLSNNLDCSIPRKRENINVSLRPVSSNRQRSDFVDATYLVKPEETILEQEIPLNRDQFDQSNVEDQSDKILYQSVIPIVDQDYSMMDYQPKLPTRLCLSPTIIQDALTSEQSTSETESTDEEEEERPTPKERVVGIDENKQRRFGQTFLLESTRTENIDPVSMVYRRPTISDDEENESIVVAEPKLATIFEKDDNSKETLVPVIKLKRLKVPKKKVKSAETIGRKTRSATKEMLEETVEKFSIPKTVEQNVKTRKRKQSKENCEEKKPKAKSRKNIVLLEIKEESEEENRTSTRSKTRRRKVSEEEDRRPSKKKKSRVEEERNNEETETRSTTERKKTKNKTRSEIESTKTKKNKNETESTNKSDSSKQHNTRSSKRIPRSTRQ